MMKFEILFILIGTSLGTSFAAANPCQGLYLGEIVANPDRCDQYFVCILTRPVKVQCDPNEVFDASKKGCVPGNPETCEIGENTTIQQTTTTTETTTFVTETIPETTTTLPSTITSTTPPTTTSTTPSTTTRTTPTTTTTTPAPVDLDEICKGVFFAAKPYPNSLSIFVGCIREKGVLFYCMQNEFFHPELNECLKWPETTPVPDTTTRIPETTTQVRVTSTTVPVTTTQVPVTSTPLPETTTTNPLEGVCDGKFFEYIEHPFDCSLFIFCYEEREIVRQCPEFYIFDLVTRKCQFGNQETCEFYPENTVPVTEPTPLPTTTKEVATTTETTTTEAIEETTLFNPCAGINNGNVANLEDCTRFYRCVQERFVPSQCSSGSVFDPSRLFCVPGNQETCEIF